MRKNILKKTIVYVIIMLFLGTGVVQGIINNYDDEMVDDNFSTENLMSDEWWDTDWLYRKQITIDHNYVDGDLNNFPVLVVHTSSDLADNAQPDGDDFVFTTADGIKLNHEIEKYDDSSGELVAWVNVPSLSSVDDTVFYIYYGNNDCSNQENIAGTWDSNYVFVQHMHGANWQNTDDSTSNNNDATGEAGNPSYQQDCKIGYGVKFDGNDYITFGTDNSLKPTVVTAHAWINLDSGSATERAAFQMPYDDGVIWDDPWVAYGFHKSANGNPNGYINEDGIYRPLTWQTPMSVGLWYHMVMTYDGNDHKLYVNGVERDSDTYPGSITYSGSPVLVAGVQSSHSHGEYWSGRVDELRVSNNARSSAWIITEYNNQNDPESFMAFGEQEDPYTLEICDITGGLFKINVVIRNVGFAEITDAHWNISLDGGLILLGQNTPGIIDSIPYGEEVTIKSNFILGIGQTIITVNAEMQTFTSDTKDEAARLLLFFIKI